MDDAVVVADCDDIGPFSAQRLFIVDRITGAIDPDRVDRADLDDILRAVDVDPLRGLDRDLVVAALDQDPFARAGDFESLYRNDRQIRISTYRSN